MKTFYKTLYINRISKIIQVDFYKGKIISYLHYRFTELKFNEQLNKDGYIVLGKDIAYPIEYYKEEAIKYRQEEITKLQSMSYNKLIKKYFNIEM